MWVVGAPCTGKSTAAWELYTSDIAAGRRVAYVDIDQLGMVYAGLGDDPDRNIIKGRAVGRVLRNFAGAGVESAIVSGVVEPADVSRYRRECHGSAVAFVRLTLDRATLVDRLRARYSDAAVTAALDFDGRLDDSSFATALDTTAHSPASVAQRLAALRASHPGAGEAIVDRPRPSDAEGSCVWVHGARAVGKSTVAWALFRQLVDEGGAAYLDVSQLSFVGGFPVDDPASRAVVAANIASVWDVFAAAGARWLVVSGVIATRIDLQSCQDLLPHVDFRPVRLTASDDDIRDRVLARGGGSGPHLAGDLLAGQSRAVLAEAAAAAQQEARRFTALDLPGPVVDTTRAAVDTTVALVRAAAALPARASDPDRHADSG